jgi:uncharacterized protein (DUF1330 family)
MRSRYALALAMSIGFAFGACAVGAVHAQRTGPAAYAIVDITEIKDPRTFKTLLPKAPAALKPFGGRYITRTESITGLDGVPPLRFVIIAFDSMSQANNWSESAAHNELSEIRMRSTNSRSFIVEAEGVQ